MLGISFSEQLSLAVANGTVAALSLVTPFLFLAYIWQRTVAARLSPDFSLRRLETMELARAEVLLSKILERLREIELLIHSNTGSLRERLRHRARVRAEFREESEDLQACAIHLRGSIVRLRRRPLHRLHRWVHILSSRFAFGGSLASYCTILVPATVFVYFAEQPLWAQELTQWFDELLLVKAPDDRMLFANGIAAAFTIVVTPVLYVAKRVKLYSDHRAQVKILADLAAADPDHLSDEPQHAAIKSFDAPPWLNLDLPERDSWFSVLGISPGASADDVRKAFRAKIKQNHPDRVQDMAPAFRHLAEAETKKLNVAYETGLRAITTQA
jgi:DnaJ like chaperone protein